MKVGILGIGFMGMIHYLAYQNVRGAKVAAICTRSKKKLSGDWRGIQGNFGPPGTKMDLSGIATYEKFEDMLADPSLDVIDICLPPGKHCETTVQTLKAGKHAFCEKPMALTTAECNKMSRAAEKAGKLLMIGHVLPFFPEYAKARQLIDSGRYGKLLGGNFTRVISDPTWIKDFYNPVTVGGPLLDLHVHDAHLIRMLFGMPESVVSQGRMRGKVVEYCNTQFRFKNKKLVVGATSGVVNQQGRAFTHAFEIHLEKATLIYDFAVIGGEGKLLMPLTVLDSRGKATNPQLTGGDPLDAFGGQLKEVTRAVRAGKPSPILGGELAQDAVILCHKQTKSVQTGKPVKV